MKLIKKIEDATYTGKDGNTYHYTSYYLEGDDGFRIPIRPAVNGETEKAQNYKKMCYQKIEAWSTLEETEEIF